MENAEQDDEVRVIVLTGAGRGFCAGADMSLLSAVAERGVDHRDLDDRGQEQVLRDGAHRREGAARDFQKKYSYFPAIGKPVIAAINGPESAQELASSVSPRSLRIIKRQVYEAMSQPLAEAFDISVREMIACFRTKDFKEGVAHFVEKRPAAFTGK